ncbi:unnamed protein product, partial [Prunus brigantina]
LSIVTELRQLPSSHLQTPSLLSRDTPIHPKPSRAIPSHRHSHHSLIQKISDSLPISDSLFFFGKFLNLILFSLSLSRSFRLPLFFLRNDCSSLISSMSSISAVIDFLGYLSLLSFN